MPTGNLQRNAYNRRRPRREPTLASASASSSPPGIADGPPTELVEGGVYILISTHDRNYGDHDDEAPLRSSSSSRQSAERGHETPRQAGTEPDFTWSLYFQRTPHLGTLYRPGEPARGVFSIVPRPRAPVPVMASSSSPGPHHHHHRLIGLVQVDRVADAAAMDRAAASTADGQLRRRARPHLDTAADERAWALAALRELRTITRGQCRITATESESKPESDLLEAVDDWAGRVARGAVGVDAVVAPVAFWWRRDWCWEVSGRVPRDWRDLAYRRHSCDTA
ncbi:hypothetical protein DL770_002149 [Monosporascus sp. CRB-9-2]|nr:hypothetical protein DL770_002149 [Monosporascus sp. CRB-9-2]